MIGRIIEVQDNNRRLSVKDGFLDKDQWELLEFFKI